ncbi:ATP-dependent DNA helicase RecQ [Arthrobacter sp. B3I4]|uniref:RecQ family ATP-dependent DNA helicase n=1 Tax=Arthrobacter sp. B3I4 TaxID=3042267 RepID=UPI0027840341|nr:RecQ family ATP-dependent DNA helicase [Arthrobacter sp. B3I4]MDQ0757349.1 ATP-dependent DNA helicase RecQ [Arthrobacter sp. B3I4]
MIKATAGPPAKKSSKTPASEADAPTAPAPTRGTATAGKDPGSGKRKSGSDAGLRTLAAEVFGFSSLHDGQLEGMRALAAGRDVLAVMPTGYGKSAIYQVPGLLLHRGDSNHKDPYEEERPTGRGTALVVSPLISLQEDQLDGLLEAAGPDAAVAINSSHGAAEQEEAWQAAESGKAAFLFLAPEQLAKDSTVERLAALNITLLVVDEAHCVTAWGHDFRPEYLRLGEVRERLGNPTTAALTATAAPPVREEIQQRLGLTEPLVLVRGFDRPNISLDVVRHHEDKEKRRAVVRQATDLVEQLRTRDAGGCGLIYAAKRKDTERYAEKLARNGLRSAAYHAGMAGAQRAAVHEQFLDGELDVVVATTAFGMGIDKPDVRFVLHADVPESLDSYYQQFGRAGRDGEPAQAVLHYRSEDLGLRRFFATHSPDEASLRVVLAVLKKAKGQLRRKALAEQTGFPPRRLTGLLNQLQDTGAISTEPDGLRLQASGNLNKAVDRAIELAESRGRIDQSRVEMIRGYAETRHCRRQFLLGYFGEDLPEPCGNCDNCTAGDADEELAAAASGAGNNTADASSDDGGFPVNAAVVHSEWGTGMIMQHDDDVLTVLFDSEGYKTLSRKAVQERGLLTLAAD